MAEKGGEADGEGQGGGLGGTLHWAGDSEEGDDMGQVGGGHVLRSVTQMITKCDFIVKNSCDFTVVYIRYHTV